MEVTSEGCGFSNTMLWIHGQRRNSYERLEDPGGGKDEEEGEKNKEGERKGGGREVLARTKGLSHLSPDHVGAYFTIRTGYSQFCIFTPGETQIKLQAWGEGFATQFPRKHL